MDSRTYKTGELAKLAGITIRTLRYYDAIGLLKPSNVQANGHRQYNTTDVEKLQLILGLKLLDFSLEEIRLYLKKPDIDFFDILSYQKQLLTQKINAYKTINSKIDFIIEHYKDIGEQRVNDVFSLYEMLQIADHSEVMKKYIPERLETVFAELDVHGSHDALHQALDLLSSKELKTMTAKDTRFLIATFQAFIRECFSEITKETIEKTTQMLAELSVNDLQNKFSIEEAELTDWLCTNLLG